MSSEDDACLVGNGGGGPRTGKGKGRAVAGLKAVGRGTQQRAMIAGVRRNQLDENRVLRAFGKGKGAADNFVHLHAVESASGLPRERFVAAVRRLRERGAMTLSTHEGRADVRESPGQRASRIHEAGTTFSYASTLGAPRRHRKNK